MLKRAWCTLFRGRDIYAELGQALEYRRVDKIDLSKAALSLPMIGWLRCASWDE